MNKLILVSTAFLLLTSGCVTKMPLISHAHMGHSLTTWHDTPGQEGLFTVAKVEVAIALKEARLAHAARDNREKAMPHVNNVIHALNADVQSFGTGLGYGAVRALTGAIDHLEFAATSEDASNNMIQSVINISNIGEDIVDQLNQALNLAVTLRSANAGQFEKGSRDLLESLIGAVNAATTDGTTANIISFEAELNAMLARETNPPYEPVSRRYVLGLVKLPNGLWGYRLPRRQIDHSRHAGRTVSGY